MNASLPIRIGIDVGGTFTDFVYIDPESKQFKTYKLPSTPENPAEAVLEGLQAIIDHNLSSKIGRLDIVHGSTVATNALIERKGARTALVTTAGFKDVLQIGRQNRPALYDLAADPPPPLIPEDRRFEIHERVNAKGLIEEPINPGDIQRVVEEIKAAGCESVAVCLLFSFLFDQHELAVANELKAAGLFTSVSSEVLPEFREYERTSTTAVNAYVSPPVKRYLDEISNGLSTMNHTPGVHLRVMQSNGGAMGIEEAGNFGVRCILSGPAGGVIGAQYLGSELMQATLKGKAPDKISRLITFDMGGTSTDVSLILGSPAITTEESVAGSAIHIPMLDIHTIGAGGGSIARVDRGGALRVGPESAGAQPGPACYGRTSEKPADPTVTDANLVLGRILPDYFLGGKMKIFPQLAAKSIDRLARDLHLTRIETALGVIEVVNAHMERALRVISVERGHDPQDFSLVSFGGAGGLHAADLARRLGIPRVIIPPTAATFSAFGLLVADVVKDYSRTVMLPGTIPPAELNRLLDQLSKRAFDAVQKEGVSKGNIVLEKMLDVRYRGQSYELVIPFSSQFREAFRGKHNEAYGYQLPVSAEIEIVNLRVRATGMLETPVVHPQAIAGPDSSRALIYYRPVHLSETAIEVPCYLAENLFPGNSLAGPALIIRKDTLVLLTGVDSAWVDAFKNIHLSIGA